MARFMALGARGTEAHRFWIHPQSYALGQAGGLECRFRIGHLEDEDDWDAGADRVVSLQSFGPSGVVDQQAQLLRPDPYGPVTILLEEPGSHILALQSHRVFSRVGAESFNEYLVNEGIQPILDHRVKHGQLERPAVEVLARCAKTIVRVGGDRSALLTRPIGMTLEIVPLHDPECAEPGALVHFEVRYRGRPLPGATVDALRLDTGQLLQTSPSDADGQFALRNSGGGVVLLHTMWGEPTYDHRSNARFATTLSSLTFTFGDDAR
ncbi:MAG: DUF4198 domain-containing protein [Parvularcula sp.]|nr:DUF4198 domain-containing protein [Parvularcula sp.]